MTDQCSTCLFCKTQGTTLLCSRAAPSPIGNLAPAANWPVAAWPSVNPTDWCGDGANASTGKPYGSTVPAITTVANLPSAASVPLMRMLVSDSAAPSSAYTVGAKIVGGGSTTMPTYSDGVIWRLG